MKLPFGKYKNEDIEDVPSYYLEWFLENIDPPTDTAKYKVHRDMMSEIEDELASREKYGEDSKR